MSTATFDLVIIGGGIVALANALMCARRKPGWRVLVLEKEERTGAHQSSHHNGVIHSPPHFPPKTL